jgi:hypothetical protein
VIEGQGIPLAARLSAAHVHDSRMLEVMVDAIPPIRRPLGRPRRRPAKLQMDKVDDFPRCRAALRQRGIIPRIARRGVEPSDRRGRHRWKVERRLAWLYNHRRLRVRDERRADIYQALLTLACSLICWNFFQHWFC